MNHDPSFKNGQFHCDQCVYTCRKQLNLKKHYVIHKERVEFSCNQCTYTSKKNHEVKIHKQVKHDGIKYKCDQCIYECAKKTILNRHIEVEHLKITYPCTQCDFIARRKILLRAHIKSVHDNFKYKCGKCDFTAVSNSSVRRHFRRDHEKVKWSCDQCDYVTKFLESFREHEKLHASGKYKEKKKEKLNRFISTQESRASPVEKNICGKSNCCVNKNENKPSAENPKSASSTSPMHKQEVLINVGSSSEDVRTKEDINIQIRSMIKQLDRGYICIACDKAILYWSHVKSHIDSFHMHGKNVHSN